MVQNPLWHGTSGRNWIAAHAAIKKSDRLWSSLAQGQRLTRVKARVLRGGHPVPEDKIVSRYSASLDQLFDAILCSNRAYIFDNSNHQHIFVAEITDDRLLAALARSRARN
jgi:predicted ABC-type ATPase